MKRVFLSFSVSILAIVVFSFAITGVASAQTPGYGCLGSCPTNQPTVTKTVDTPTQAVGQPNQEPTTVATYPTMIQEDVAEPCIQSQSQAGSLTERHHHHHSGGGFFQKFFEFFMKLFEWLLQLIGGGQLPEFPIDGDQPSDPDDGDQPDDGDEPKQPCDNPDDGNEPEPTRPEPVATQAEQPTVPVATTNPGTTVAPTQPGSPIAGCTQSDIQNLVNSVSQANIEANLRALVQDDSQQTPNELISRHISSPGNQIKVDWAKQQLASYGLQVIEQPFSSGGYNLENAVARVNGSDPNSLYAVGGHIDSINDDDNDGSAPGANDDGSGFVVAMEVGRVLKGYEQCLKSSIDIVGWNDEEEEMEGSASYVRKLSGVNFKGAVSMDMIGYTPDGQCLKSDVENGQDESFSQAVVARNQTYNLGFNVTHDTQSDMGDDASSFWDAGLPAIYMVECSTEDNANNDPGYHSANDKIQNVNFEQLAQTARLLVAALAELASE